MGDELDFLSFSGSRTLCDVLEEMRKCHQTYNFGYLPSLIEEAQHMGNRMEAALGTKGDIEYRTRKLNDLKKEIKQLRTELVNLKTITENSDD